MHLLYKGNSYGIPWRTRWKAGFSFCTRQIRNTISVYTWIAISLIKLIFCCFYYFSSESISVLFKDATQDEIQTALNRTLKQERYLSTRATNLLLGKRISVTNKENVLTSTEQDILKLLALGKTTKEIAQERFSSVHTITTHRKNIFRKLEVNTVYEATKYALRAGVVDSAEYYIWF